ncbi:short-chain dehydrogenase/reductase family 42E member 1-like [Daphnia pulicaria]|uniref:short-chain dehydrogenase/reductase family 42E member 1-like n=1 Tax=Daphnia pulicaria TaxID=35523 RepID=UPI001EEA5BCF|nr:short-chain dehydrogenase/reductase family 42E member 1-like [Daphnia pulicaria]
MYNEHSCTFLITGGAGYIGFHVGLQLLQLKHKVILLDINYPNKKWDSNLEFSPNGNGEELEDISCSYGTMKFVKGDVRDINILLRATQGVTCVIHTVGYGMSGVQQMPSHSHLVEEININGTRNVIEACVKNNCRGLVYTSTNNVVFGGHPIFNGDESLPYYPLHKQSNHYSKTKTIAEQLVLTSNGRGDLQTCALRLTAVIGRDEVRTLPRTVWSIRNGLLAFKFHDKHGSLVDWIGIDNAVQGHVKAALKLVDPDRKTPGIGGQAFFLSDGRPISYFDYVKPIYEYYGQPFPAIRVPVWLMNFFVFLIMYVCSLWSALFFECAPFLNSCELEKSVVTHYFSIDKARKELDYHPLKPNDLSDIIDCLSENEW